VVVIPLRLFLALAATLGIPLSLLAAPAFVPPPADSKSVLELVQKKSKWNAKGKMKGQKMKMKGKKGKAGSCMCENKCSTKPPGCMTKCLRNCKVN
jgi:hypothetical protein